MIVRPMRPGDVDAAVALINAYAAEDRMLERTPEFVHERLGDFLVAVEPSEDPASPFRASRPVIERSEAAQASEPIGERDEREKEQDGFLGCVAVASLTGDLAEIRSLAVERAASGRGIGRTLVHAAVEEARRRGLRRVFALTLVPEFFERCGFTLVSLGRLPEKSAAECPICPKRSRCDEQAMLLHLDGTKPQRLQPQEPVGYTRLMELTATRAP